MPKQGEDEFSPILEDIRGSLVALWKIFRSFLGFAFMAAWWEYSKLRLRIAPALPYVFVFVATLDFGMLLVAGLMELDHRMHDKILLTDSSWRPSGLHGSMHDFARWLAIGPRPYIAFSVISLVLGWMMFRHHHRVTERDKHYLLLLGSLRELSAEATRLVVSASKPEASHAFIETALQTLALSTMRFKGVLIQSITPASVQQHGLNRSAIVLDAQAGGDLFHLKYRWPPTAYTGIPPDRPIRASAASKALEYPRALRGGRGDKGIVYIPWRKVPHGLRHWSDTTGNRANSRLEYVRDASTELGTAPGDQKPVSLICTEIVARGRSYVLCLDSNRWKCFGEVDFYTLLLVASIIGSVLTELHGQTDAGQRPRAVEG